jgi:hypothetical protein
MPHGKVEIIPFEGGENIAQFVAFAASVLAPGSSTPDAIRSIGSTLGEFTAKQPSVRVIAAPLLGAGAGGLQSEAVVASLREGFLSSAHPGALLIVMCYIKMYLTAYAEIELSWEVEASRSESLSVTQAILLDNRSGSSN